MERKIGEIFEFGGEWYQCVGGTCRNCSFYYDTVCKNITIIGSTNFGNCHCSLRTDHKSVIFKKLEKWGGPYPNADKLYQLYRLPMNIEKLPPHTEGINLVRFDIVEIEIKQNKEDMKENEENKYDGKMDKECIPLCDALNSLPDVETTESCCGHCKDRFRIFFKCKNPYSLSVIARVFNRRYSGTKLQWIIEVETHDNGGYDYFVHSVKAYENNTMMEKDISQLVENIKYWSSEKYKEHFINRVTNEEKKEAQFKTLRHSEGKRRQANLHKRRKKGKDYLF